MTLLSEDESRSKRGRRKRSPTLRALQMLLAILKARSALRRITRPRRTRLSDIPPYLRRDIGLPEVDNRFDAVGIDIAIMTYLRLK